MFLILHPLIFYELSDQVSKVQQKLQTPSKGMSALS